MVTETQKSRDRTGQNWAKKEMVELEGQETESEQDREEIAMKREAKWSVINQKISWIVINRIRVINK